MKKNKLILLGILIITLPLIIHSQSNTVIDEMLNKDKAGFGRTSYLVFSASGILDDEATIEESLGYLGELKWNMTNKQSEDDINLGQYSYMLMKSFNINGGLMYQLFPGPRYAAKELYYLGFIDENSDPVRSISGEEVLRILGRLLEWKEENQ
jgi:hypothetical protein